MAVTPMTSSGYDSFQLVGYYFFSNPNLVAFTSDNWNGTAGNQVVLGSNFFGPSSAILNALGAKCTEVPERYTRA